MTVDMTILSMAYNSRKFVKNISRQIERGVIVPDRAMADYNALKETAAFSKNPIKNIFNYFSTVKAIKKEIAEFKNSIPKQQAPEGGYKAFA